MKTFRIELLCLLCFCQIAVGQKSIPTSLKTFYPNFSDYRVTHSHKSKKSNIVHTYLVQTYQEYDIVNQVASIHTDDKDNVIRLNNGLLPHFSTLSFDKNPKISIDLAIQKIKDDLNISTPNAKLKIILDEKTNQFSIKDSTLSQEPITGRKAFFANGKSLKLIFQVIVKTPDDWWDIRVDANTGEIIEKINWVSHCNLQGHDHEQGGHLHDCKALPFVANSYNIWKLKVESPIHGSRTIEVLPHNLLASPYGWHDTSGVAGPEFTVSRGNNVDAKDDIANDNETTIGARAEGGAMLEFNFPFLQNVTATTNLNASIANLFYWNNIVHDVFYQYGFDEAAGNFQYNNYNRGGLRFDNVLADALDGGGTNNANFGTPPDGSNPRMQMYKWNFAKVTINSPSSIASTLSATDAVKAAFGPAIYEVTGDAMLADPILACTALTNNLSGKVAIIDRGTCNFDTKIINAQTAGAIAALVCQNTASAPTAMTGGTGVTIPSFMLSQAKCNEIKNAMTTQTVNITLRSKELDSSFDSGVITHEYGHGISNRLTGGAANTGCLSNQEQMGEGWSDWLGLMLTMKSSDTATKIRGIGNYLTTLDTNGVGIRPYPYSTNMTINPHTYDNIKTGVSVPHGIGSVWCAMLWEVTWAMINQYGYNSDLYNGNGGNNMAMHLVLEGMKLQPCYPGFVDGRDAILLADQVLYGGQNQCLLWTAFAKRGLGFSATQGSSHNKADGAQAFDLPPSCSKLVLSIKKDLPFAANTDTITYTIKVKNISTDSIVALTVVDTLPSNLSFVSSNVGTHSAGVISFPIINLQSGVTMTYTVKGLVNAPLNPIPEQLDNAETLPSKYATTKTNNLMQGFVRSTNTPYQGSYSWYASDEASSIVKYFTLKSPVKIAEYGMLSFWHKYQTESQWDGGRVYISTDSMLTWKDLGPHMTLNGYNSYINNVPTELAFSGTSTGYVNTLVNLMPFKDSIVFIRFALHCDVAVGDLGWFIDNISLLNTQPTITNRVYQSNSTTSKSEAFTYLPTQIVPCTTVYSATNAGQGSLRRAVSCANNLDSIYVINDLIGDTLSLTSTLNINKDLFFGKPTHPFAINFFNASPALSIQATKTVHLQNVNMYTNTASKAIENFGFLKIKNSSFKNISNAAGVIVGKPGSTLILEENVQLKKQ